jgi:hypothetical protein
MKTLGVLTDLFIALATLFLLLLWPAVLVWVVFFQ